jgi:AraC-like DNA-binding protein
MLNSSTAIARVLGGLPEFVQLEFGEKALNSALARSDLPVQILENRDLYIPKSSIASFLDNASRQAGEERLGLMLAPHHTVSSYGVLGNYYLSANNLQGGLNRTKKSLIYHSTGDKVNLSVHGDLCRYEYLFGMRRIAGYDQVIPCSVGGALSIFKHYLGSNWVPEHVEVNIPKPRQTSIYEETFGCPVVFGAASVAIVARREVLDAPNPFNIRTSTPTIRDVAHACNGGAPQSLRDNIRQNINIQLLNGQVSIDSSANTLNMGIRKLQRELEFDGHNFRSLVSEIRSDRAKDLLFEDDFSIAQISEILGYSTSSHFARAFRKQCGMSPLEFRCTLNYLPN